MRIKKRGYLTGTRMFFYYFFYRETVSGLPYVIRSFLCRLHGKPSTIPKQNGVEDVISKKKKRKPKKKKAATVEELDVSRLRAYGVGTKKLRRLMYNKKLEKKAANKNECE